MGVCTSLKIVHFSEYLLSTHHHDMAIHRRSSSRNSLSAVSPELKSDSLPDTESTRTNTLVLASIPASFFEPVVLDALRSHFESYGEIHTWAPLKAFARVIIVYYDEEAAELAKESCDSLFIDATDFRCADFPPASR